MMKYESYLATVSFDNDDNLFYGEVVNLRDVITFQGDTVDELRLAFQESVDDYLAFCLERGESPEKPFSGKFCVRMDPNLHRQLSVRASADNKYLNSWLNENLTFLVAE